MESLSVIGLQGKKTHKTDQKLIFLKKITVKMRFRKGEKNGNLMCYGDFYEEIIISPFQGFVVR